MRFATAKNLFEKNGVCPVRSLLIYRLIVWAPYTCKSTNRNGTGCCLSWDLWWKFIRVFLFWLLVFSSLCPGHSPPQDSFFISPVIITHQRDLLHSSPVAAVQFTGRSRQFTGCASTDHRMRQYRSPDAPVQITGCASTDRRMRQYRSPDAPVQITGCASTDRRMRNFRAGNAAGSARGVVEKK